MPATGLSSEAALQQLWIELTLQGYDTLGKPFRMDDLMDDLLLAVEHALSKRRAVA